LPEAPTDDWRTNFTATQLEEMAYRMGNLTPLEPSFNRDLGQQSYLIKREKYQQSVYTLTQNITAEDWTPDTLVVRQKHLAQRAAHIWRSDFSS
jgi:Protein of unknown function (DUF1524)